MEIFVSNTDKRPIYEQISSQIKSQILSSTLQAGEPLPSIRFLAQELKISVITTKRAYEDLEREGFVFSIPGKGTFVADKNTDFIREEYLRQVDEYLVKAIHAAKAAGVTVQELQESLSVLYEE